MKVVAVLGSPSKNGNTCVLAREVLNGARSRGATVSEIFLAAHEIGYCRGCISRDVERMCMSTGACIIDDDANALRDLLYESDGIVLASPAYGLMPTARMKNFIVDRIGMFTVYTSALGGKYFVGVATCGGMGARKVARTLPEHFLTGFHQRGYRVGSIGVTLGNDRIESKPEALKKAHELGAKLADAITKQRTYPFQDLIGRLMMKLVVRRIILKNIYANKDGRMKAVYENLVRRGLITT